MKNEARATLAFRAPPVAMSHDFRLEEFLPYQLSVAATRVSRLLNHRYVAASGLTIAEWRVLTTIARFGAVSPSAVGEWTAMDKVKVSRASAELVASGLIRQSTDPNDGRGRLLRMTRKGRSVHDRLVPQARALEALLADRVGRTRWAALNKTLVRLNGQVRSIAGMEDGRGAD